jgi:hypothetical protein
MQMEQRHASKPIDPLRRHGIVKVSIIISVKDDPSGSPVR